MAQATVTMWMDVARLKEVREALAAAAEVVREATNLAVINAGLNERIDELEARLAQVTAERDALRAKEV